MLEDKSGNYPHVFVTTSHNCCFESSGTVLLGELAVIITIIRNRMREEKFRDKDIFPVRLPSHSIVILSNITN